MNRQYIDDCHVVARYLADQLADGERRAFEAYYLTHPEMLQELEAAARFKVGLMQLRDADKIDALLVPQPWYRRVRFIARALWPFALSLLTMIAHAEGGHNSTTSISSPRSTMTVAEFDELFERLSRQTWGRWGKQDQIGALNLVRIEESQRALANRRGRVVSLGRPLVPGRNAEGQAPLELVSNPHPRGCRRGRCPEFFGESYRIEYHGTLTTHLDVWCHASYHGQHYNGIRARDVHSAQGCTAGGLPVVVTRGVMLDIAGCEGVAYLEAHTSITVAQIEKCERQLGVRVRAGDAVLVRTGQWARREHLLRAGQWKPPFEFAGLHPAVATWLADRGVAIIGTDAALDRMPSDVPGVNFPLHKLALAALGILVVDSLDLETLASVAADEFHQWDFGFFLAPLRVVGATGGPVNPVAVF